MIEQPAKPPCFVVNFNEMLDRDLVLLAKEDIRLDSSGTLVTLSEGMEVIVCEDDVGEDGQTDRLIARGTVERNVESGLVATAKWACRIDENGVRHESEIENEFDDILFGFSDSPSQEIWSEEVWVAVVRHLVDQIAKMFGQVLEIVDNGVDFDDGFCIDFRTGGADAVRLSLRLRGIVGAQVIEGSLLVRAWVFLYLGDERLREEIPGDVLAMRYIDTDRGGAWHSDGWEYGYPDEWAAFERFDG
jgi:hypothetical protein